jgi:mono/diheme cytochrome c family protein
MMKAITFVSVMLLGATLALQSHAADSISAQPSYWSNTPVTGDMPQGKRTFLQFCDVCHGRAPGRPGTEELKLKYMGALPAALEDREDLTVETVTFVVRKGFGLMAPVRRTEISDAGVRALAEYLAKGKAPVAKAAH